MWVEGIAQPWPSELKLISDGFRVRECNRIGETNNCASAKRAFYISQHKIRLRIVTLSIDTALVNT